MSDLLDKALAHPLWSCFRGAMIPALMVGAWLLLLVVVAACSPAQVADTPGPDAGATSDTAAEGPSDGIVVAEAGTEEVPRFDVFFSEEDVTIAPLPVRAGFPFTVTATLWYTGETAAQTIPFFALISPVQESLGYQPFVQVLTVTLPATEPVQVDVPVNWNFGGGEHQLWLQANRLPEAWQQRYAVQPELDVTGNMVLMDLMIDPFDAYTSELCSGRVDVQVGPEDVLPEPDQQRVLVRVRNEGNAAVYNLPVIVLGDQLSGIAHTPAIPPCGGTAEVYVTVDRPFEQGELLRVQVNPKDWAGGLVEDDYSNNQVSVTGGLAPGVVVPPGGGLDDYDFGLSAVDIESPELWIVLVTVHNLGTRDADRVPIRIENEAGRNITDEVPLVQGSGSGVAAFRVGYLWTRGGTLTFTVNPPEADGAYPETNRENNTATFTLP
ncbi:MAG: hypothetical protein PVG54_01535 [Anaerolineae bacterium]